MQQIIRDAKSVDANASFGNLCAVSLNIKAPSPDAKGATFRDVSTCNVRAIQLDRDLSQERLRFEAELDRTQVSRVQRGQ